MDKQEVYHIVCYSQGHSSALVAIEIARKYGIDKLILINHGMNANVEESDIRRFGLEVSKYIGVDITYINYNNIPDLKLIPDQFDIALKFKAFKSPGTSNAICTNRLKTEPFNKFLESNFPINPETGKNDNCIIYYGFDASEERRMNRRSSILGAMGYYTDYPLIWQERTIFNTKEIGIEPPNTYSKFKHANCTGCLKAGMKHWYVVFCVRNDLYKKAKMVEEELGYTILRRKIKGVLTPFSLEEFEPIFQKMKCDGVPSTEHMTKGEFDKYLKKYSIEVDDNEKPCECFV